MQEADPLGHAMGCRVTPGYFKSFFAQVDGSHAGAGLPVGNGHRQVAGASPEVKDARRVKATPDAPAWTGKKS